MITMSLAVLGFLVKNFMVLRDLDNTVKRLLKTIDKIMDKQDAHENRILSLEEKTKFNQERVEVLEKRMYKVENKEK